MEGKSSEKNHLNSNAEEGTKPYLLDDPFAVRRMWELLLTKMSDNDIYGELRNGDQRIWKKRHISDARHNMKKKAKKALRNAQEGKHEYADQIMETLARLYTNHENFVQEVSLFKGLQDVIWLFLFSMKKKFQYLL